MTSREKILGRIREALKVKAPLPGHVPAVRPPESASQVRQWLPRVGLEWEEQRELFARHAATLKADFKVLADEAAVASAVGAIAGAEGWTRLAAHRTPLVEAAVASAGVEVLWVEDGVSTAELEACDGGVTGCEALIAQTGSVLVTTRSSGGRALSVLPPHHIVIAKREQLLPDLAAAFQLMKSKYAEDYPSILSFITGPSRTGDIERILVLGAHGPRKLTILCVPSSLER